MKMSWSLFLANLMLWISFKVKIIALKGNTWNSLLETTSKDNRGGGGEGVC